MDFTLETYSRLLAALRDAGYAFAPVKDSFAPSVEGARVVHLRHDVDLRPRNSMAVARLEAGKGICATYYFRAVEESWDESIIREIASMGHEVGYHYESLTTCRGDVDAAWADFRDNLRRLRLLAPVETVCMHGSPRSPYDSRDILKKYDYKSLGIVGEPYLDTDWSGTFYLTDTGRRWDGFRVSVRDRIPLRQDEWCRRGLVFHSTEDVIRGAGGLPDRVMITTHPQRWSDEPGPWVKEMVLQNVKNVVKALLIKG